MLIDGIVYGKWRIYYDPTPLPYRTLDWTYVHDDYDGAPDANDNRCGRNASAEDCIAAIKEMEDEC